MSNNLVNPYRHGGGVSSSLLTDLVSWWALDETSGTRYDSHGSVDLTDNNTVGYTTGKQGNAALFVEGQSEYLNNTSASALSSSGDLAICCWASRDTGASNNEGQVLFSDVSGTSIVRVSYKNDSGAVPKFFVRDGSGTTGQLDWSSTVADDTLHFIYCDYRASDKRMRIAVNGGAFTTLTHPGTGLADTVTQVHLGIHDLPVASVQYKDGITDEVAVWHRILTDDEISTLYASGAGITYNDIADGSWSYNSLASAEASGDSWVDGDTVKILGGATFVYKSALDTNGHI